MGERRTAWHYFLGLLLTEKAPRCFEVLPEVPVTLAVQRIDYLLLRRRPWKGAPDRGETLVGLWPELPLVSLAEYKSASRRYRRGEIHRTLGYGHQYASEHHDELGDGALALVLLVPSRNAALDDDLRRLGVRERPLGGGYARVEGLAFPLLLVDLSAVAARDRDDYVALFAEGARVPVEARSWWYARHGTRTEDGMDPKQMDDFKAMERRYLESFPIEERLAGLRPEDRLAGLSDHEAVLALPDSVLLALADAYVDALPEDIRSAVRSRRARLTSTR